MKQEQQCRSNDAYNDRFSLLVLKISLISVEDLKIKRSNRRWSPNRCSTMIVRFDWRIGSMETTSSTCCCPIAAFVWVTPSGLKRRFLPLNLSFNSQFNVFVGRGKHNVQHFQWIFRLLYSLVEVHLCFRQIRAKFRYRAWSSSWNRCLGITGNACWTYGSCALNATWFLSIQCATYSSFAG